MSTTSFEIVRLTAAELAQRKLDIAEGRETPEATAAVFFHLATDTARRELMAGLPLDRQVAIVMATSATEELPGNSLSRTGSLCLSGDPWKGKFVLDAGTEVPAIVFLDPDEAVEVIALDTSLCAPVSEQELWRLASDAGVDVGNEDALAEYRADHIFEVRSPTGVLETRPLSFDPSRAFAYLSSIFRSKDEAWQTETLEKLGPDIMALLYAFSCLGEFDVDEELWLSFIDEDCPEWYRRLALRTCKRCGRDALLEEVIDSHRAAMEAAFGASVDRVAVIQREAATAASLAAEMLDDI